MQPKKFSLCPLCEACPEVVITDEGVTIGEDATLNGTNSSRSSSAARLAKFNEVGRGSLDGAASPSWSLSIASKSSARDRHHRVHRLDARLRDAGSCCVARGVRCFR